MCERWEWSVKDDRDQEENENLSTMRVNDHIQDKRVVTLRIWEWSSGKDERIARRMRLIAGFLCFFLFILTGGTISYIYIMWEGFKLMNNLNWCHHADHCHHDPNHHNTDHDALPKVDKLLASSHCHWECAHVKTGESDEMTGGYSPGRETACEGRQVGEGTQVEEELYECQE